MADSNLTELKSIVKAFRVSELIVLLSFAGRNKIGRKSELLERALALCTRHCSTAIVIKIHEINKMRNGLDLNTQSSSPSRNQAPAPPTAPSVAPPLEPPRPPPRQSLVPPRPPAGDKQAGTTQSSTSVQAAPQISVAVQATDRYVSDVMAAASLASSSSTHTSLVPLHPDVRLKRLPFYDFQHELIKPTSLPVRGLSRFQQSSYSFHFTPKQAIDIGKSRCTTNELIEEFGVQVLLRFCLAETTCDQLDMFPSSICVRVNGKMAQLPNPIPTNKPGVEPKRPGRPVDITHSCKLVATEANRIDVSWATDNIRNFCINVTLEQRLDSNVLLQRLKQRGLRHADHTRALIKEKLATTSDSEIATTSLRVSLICPLGKMRMVVPARSSGCSHLQCFDAPTYIHMNEKKSSWLCPICDRSAEFCNLFIDGALNCKKFRGWFLQHGLMVVQDCAYAKRLFTEILSKTSETNDIEFSASGQWSPFSAKTVECKINDSLVQALDDNMDTSGPGAVGGVSCIDLTESDDEAAMLPSPTPSVPSPCPSAPSPTPSAPSPAFSVATSTKSSYSLSSGSTITGAEYALQTASLLPSCSYSRGDPVLAVGANNGAGVTSSGAPVLDRPNAPTRRGSTDDPPPPLSPYWGADIWGLGDSRETVSALPAHSQSRPEDDGLPSTSARAGLLSNDALVEYLRNSERSLSSSSSTSSPPPVPPNYLWREGCHAPDVIDIDSD